MTPKVQRFGKERKQLFIDPLTGLASWESPQIAGRYVIAIEVTTYRDGEVQDKVVRDMITQVGEDEKLPPQLSLNGASLYQEVAVGDTVLISASAVSNSGNPLQLTATGGMFDFFGEPADFETVAPATVAAGEFQWIPEAADLREAPYQVNFRAQDTVSRLSDLQPVRIKVVESTTSVASLSATKPLQVFPNPTADLLYINLPAETHMAHYQLFDAQGRMIRSSRVTEVNTTIDIATLPAGWYQLYCWSDKALIGTARVAKY